MIPREFYCTKMQNYFQTFVFAFNTEFPSFFFLKRRHHLFFKGSIHQRHCSEKSVTIRAELGLGLGLGRFPFKLRVENGLAIVWLKPPLLLTLVRVWQVLVGGYLHTIFTYDHKGRALENLLEFFRRTLTNYFMLVFYVTSILSIEELHGWSCDTGAIQKCFCLHICGVVFFYNFQGNLYNLPIFLSISVCIVIVNIFVNSLWSDLWFTKVNS